MHVYVEHANKMGVVSPIKREQSLPTLLFGDGRDKSVLESSKVYDTLNLYVSTTKRHSICLLPPNSESTQLKEFLGRKDPRRALVT